MARWRVLVADDEPAARRGVQQLLAPFSDFTIVGECRDGREVLAALERLRPDVVFLDIQMPEMDGFEVIRRRTQGMPALVFLTAFDQFAVRAFEADAQDYLVKPVTEARFTATIRRLTQRLSDGSPGREQSIIVPTSRGTLVIPLREIDWIEAADYYARVWAGGRSYLLRESLEALEQRVSSYGFARAHRKALVRLGCVRELRSRANGMLVALLASGTRVPVSRRRRGAFAAAVRTLGS
jgi:two-component system LytT family response regulator